MAAESPCPGPVTARLRLFVPVVLAVMLSACAKSDVPAADAKKKPSTTVPVMMATVERKPMALTLQAIGNVEPYASVGIKSRVDGQIVEVGFRDGEDVKKGQPLFRIDPRPFQAELKQAEAALLRDRAQLERARNQEKRYKELLEKNFVSKDAYAQFATNVETAEAAVRASEAAVETAHLQLDYSLIRSPIDGRAGKTLIQLGNVVKANDTSPLLIINQLSPIYLNFAVPEQYLGEIRRAMSEHSLKAQAMASEADAPVQEGQLSFIDNTVDASTGTVRLRAVFPNSARTLWPGQFATARLTLGVQKEALVVPSQAVQTGANGQYVYVVGEDMVATVHPVTVDRVAGEETIIAKGLQVGERVVTVGQLRLAPGSKVRAAAEPVPEAAKASVGAGAAASGKGER